MVKYDLKITFNRFCFACLSFSKVSFESDFMIFPLTKIFIIATHLSKYLHQNTGASRLFVHVACHHAIYVLSNICGFFSLALQW